MQLLGAFILHNDLGLMFSSVGQSASLTVMVFLFWTLTNIGLYYDNNTKVRSGWRLRGGGCHMLLSGSTKRAWQMRLFLGSLPGNTTTDFSVTNSLHLLDGDLPGDGPCLELDHAREKES